MQNFLGKTAIITGGSRGIGKGIAQRFVENGANVVIFSTQEGPAKETLRFLEELRCNETQKIVFYRVDVSQSKEVNTALSEVIKEFQKIDILVNAAGITRDNLFIRMSEEEWDRVIAVNLKSLYNTTHSLIRLMIKQRSGKIINISSVIGLIGNPGQTNYAASKAGMIGFTRALAKEVASRNITVNCIAPGFIETDMTACLSEEQKNGILDQVPMKRLGKPLEIADTVLFLASEAAEYITGQVITVDGGMTA